MSNKGRIIFFTWSGVFSGAVLWFCVSHGAKTDGLGFDIEVWFIILSIAGIINAIPMKTISSRAYKNTSIMNEKEKDMIIKRVWAMPSIWTFSIKPIMSLISKYHVGIWGDAFAGQTSPAEITNDIEGRGAIHKMDALDFLKSLNDDSFDGFLFDPPYSVEQCLRRYTPKQKGTAGRAEYWAKCKDEIMRVVKQGGTVISFGWDSTGIGKKRGFEIIEIMLVCHGACHNDTIVTVETKISNKLF